jgi:hypothetical protein
MHEKLTVSFLLCLFEQQPIIHSSVGVCVCVRVGNGMKPTSLIFNCRGSRPHGRSHEWIEGPTNHVV